MEVDAAAESRTRSELFREAARQYLRRGQRRERIFGSGARAALRTGVASEEEVADVITELRRARRENPAR